MIDTKLHDDGVTEICLSRIAQKNAVDTSMWHALDEAATGASQANVVLITSAVPHMFCPGADIKEFPSLIADPAKRTEMRGAMQRALQSIACLPMPVLAAINGACVGAGVSIAMACDLRLASETARMGITPAKLGLHYAADDLARLVSVIGPAQTKRLLYTADILPAREALRIGLITCLLPGDDFTASARAFAAQIAGLSSETQRSVKAMLTGFMAGQPLDPSIHNQAFDDAFVSADAGPRIAAMLEALSPG